MNFNIPELICCDDVFRDRITFCLAFYGTFSRENESSAPSHKRINLVPRVSVTLIQRLTAFREVKL